jgi:hypothetical protein
MGMSKERKWKDILLKSSLPLEYLVAAKLRTKKCSIMGEFAYLRPNENGIDTEFSVDIWSLRTFLKGGNDLWGMFHLLVECKYCHPNVRWVFTPLSETDIDQQLDMEVVHAMDHICTRMIWNRRPLWKLRHQFPMCIKGVELLPNGSTTENIDRGKAQLVYGLPNLVAHAVDGEALVSHDEDLKIELFSGILVTTAPLFLLKRGLTLESFTDAKQLTDVADEVPALILSIRYSHLFTRYVDKIISSLYDKDLEIKPRLNRLSVLSGKADIAPGIPANIEFDFFIRRISDLILIVNYEHLGSIVDKLHATILKVGGTLRKVGVFRKDMATGEFSIDPVLMGREGNSGGIVKNSKS